MSADLRVDWDAQMDDALGNACEAITIGERENGGLLTVFRPDRLRDDEHPIARFFGTEQYMGEDGEMPYARWNAREGRAAVAEILRNGTGEWNSPMYGLAASMRDGKIQIEVRGPAYFRGDKSARNFYMFSPAEARLAAALIEKTGEQLRSLSARDKLALLADAQREPAPSPMKHSPIAGATLKASAEYGIQYGQSNVDGSTVSLALQDDVLSIEAWRAGLGEPTVRRTVVLVQSHLERIGNAEGQPFFHALAEGRPFACTVHDDVLGRGVLSGQPNGSEYELSLEYPDRPECITFAIPTPHARVFGRALACDYPGDSAFLAFMAQDIDSPQMHEKYAALRDAVWKSEAEIAQREDLRWERSVPSEAERAQAPILENGRAVIVGDARQIGIERRNSAGEPIFVGIERLGPDRLSIGDANFDMRYTADAVREALLSNREITLFGTTVPGRYDRLTISRQNDGSVRLIHQQQARYDAQRDTYAFEETRTLNLSRDEALVLATAVKTSPYAQRSRLAKAWSAGELGDVSELGLSSRETLALRAAIEAIHNGERVPKPALSQTKAPEAPPHVMAALRGIRQSSPVRARDNGRTI